MASKSPRKRTSAANRGKAKSRGRRATPEYTTSPLVRSVALVALGALAAFGATSYFNLPKSLDAPRPQASVERNVPAQAHAKAKPGKQAERSRMPARHADRSPDRSIRTAGVPVPRPPKPLVDARKPADTPKSVAMRPPLDVTPRPQAGLPHAMQGDAPRKTALPQAAAPKSVRLAGLAFPICGEGPGKNCVIDADTFVLNGKAYRVADIEVPLSADPKCRREAMLADRAKQRLKALLNAGPLELRAAGPDEDVYGRKLRTLHRDGRSLGATLVSEGLARPAGGNKGWCT